MKSLARLTLTSAALICLFALHANAQSPSPRRTLDFDEGWRFFLGDPQGAEAPGFDDAGNVWLADTETHSVRMIDAKSGNLELIAGTGAAGDGADSDPLKCAMNRLHGIFVDTDGSILIGDSEAHRVRVLRKK